MDTESHVKILAQGIEIWNLWRLEHSDVTPNLRQAWLGQANLIGVNLAGADLTEAHLEGANLTDAQLQKSCLKGAHLGGVRKQGDSLAGITLNRVDPDSMDFGGKDIIWTDLSNADLREADLTGADCSGADLGRANFTGAHFDEVNCTWANLRGAIFFGATLRKSTLYEADLSEAHFEKAHLEEADLEGAKLQNAYLSGANLAGANLRRANLQGADLSDAVLNSAQLQIAQFIDTNVEGADFDNAHVHGISVWGLKGTPKGQHGLVISASAEAAQITVDDLEVAQFIYLLLKREKLRNVIQTITSKAVLILGRFTRERKEVLDALANELRARDLLPIIFDFERAEARDFTETIKILAGLSLFVIADITNPKSAPLELQATIPDYQIPFVPIIQEGEEPFSMFSDLGKYTWVLEPVAYPSLSVLLQIFDSAILDRALEEHAKLQTAKAEKVHLLSWRDFPVKRQI
jgi:uncharacterized protein YjbI with pentapeptide repeats